MDIRNFFKKPRLDSPSASTSANLNENENPTDQKNIELQLSSPSVIQEQANINFVDCNDIANYINRNLTDIEKKSILNNAWKPPHDFKFPINEVNGRKLRFQYNWLQEYFWLCYSMKENGAFCLPCSIFASVGGVNSRPLGKLVKMKFDNWKKAKEVSNW